MNIYTRLGYSLSYENFYNVLKTVKRNEIVQIQDIKVRFKWSQRISLFKKSNVCVSCGRVGTIFHAEIAKGQKVPHFNLYSVDLDGKEMLMTKDHIVPKSKGGKDRMGNYQTMCFECNNKKGDLYEFI